MQQLYPRLYQMRKARLALANHRFQEAQTYFHVITPDPYWKDYHLYLAERSIIARELDTALAHAKAAVQLQEYYQPGYLTLGLTYMARNELPEALAALRYGLTLDSRASLILLNLAMVHSWQNHQDSVLFYAKRLYEVDTTSVLGRCLLARGYFYAGDREQALIHALWYIEHGRGSDEYDKLSRELVGLMPELGQ
jgi:tetratricopeptide (TPR) repeat protein